jgi:hypothetical protein
MAIVRHLRVFSSAGGWIVGGRRLDRGREAAGSWEGGGAVRGFTTESSDGAGAASSAGGNIKAVSVARGFAVWWVICTPASGRCGGSLAWWVACNAASCPNLQIRRNYLAWWVVGAACVLRAALRVYLVSWLRPLVDVKV